MTPTFLLPCAAAALALLASCQTTVNGRNVPASDASEAGELPEPSPLVAEQIDTVIRDVPFLRGRQIVGASAEIVRIGPPAIRKLLDAVADPDPTRRSFALNVLGALGDRRVLPAMREALNDSDAGVRYEAARSSARLGDWAGFPVLIAGLRDASEYARTLCHDSLQRQTKLDFGFRPRDAEADREKAVERWLEWWRNHSRATLAARS